MDYSSIRFPSLFLVSEGEAAELKRQTHGMYEDFSRRSVNVTLHEFTADEGADGHGELNNIRRLHQVVFDWLDRVFGKDPSEARLVL